MEETISLQEIFKTLKKHVKLIIGIVLGVLIVTALYTFFVLTPQYQASTQILVNQSQSDDQPITSTELQSNRELINTYNIIVTSPVIMQAVINETGIDRSVSELQEKVTVNSEDESQVFTLAVEDSNPNTAVVLANTISEVFEREISSIMNIDNVSLLSEAQISDTTEPISPQPLLNLVIALVIGLMLALAIAFIIEFLDQTIKTESDVEKDLKLPLLGAVSVITNQDVLDNNRIKKDLDVQSSRSSRKTS